MKKEQMVGTRLSEQVVRDLEMIEQEEQADRSTTVRKLLYKAIGSWKLDHYGRLYGAGRVTLARAAREAGVSIWEMVEYVRAHKIAAQYDPEDLERDIRTIHARRGK
jgi:hypothetical protein